MDELCKVADAGDLDVLGNRSLRPKFPPIYHDLRLDDAERVKEARLSQRQLLRAELTAIASYLDVGFKMIVERFLWDEEHLAIASVSVTRSTGESGRDPKRGEYTGENLERNPRERTMQVSIRPSFIVATWRCVKVHKDMRVGRIDIAKLLRVRSSVSD